MDLILFLGVVALIIALHYLLWGKIYRDWFGDQKGIKKGLLFLTCLLGEALITVFFGIYVLNL